MTAEGSFPKVDGDILYASEVNRFARAGGLIAAGSTASAGSSTNFQTIGSVFVSGINLAAVSASTWAGFTIDSTHTGTASQAGASFAGSINYRFSGTALQNITLNGPYGAATDVSAKLYGHTNVFVNATDTMSHVIGGMWPATPTTSLGRQAAFITSVGSPFVIFIESVHNGNTAGQTNGTGSVGVHYIVQSQRGAV